MSTPATRSRENTRARLLEAAAQVFAEVGLEGATVEAVCERAGFTRGAFYSNFESKDELFLALSASVAEARLNAVRERVAALAAQGAFADVDPVTLVREVMDAVGDDRLGVMLHSEIRIRALRDPAAGAAFLAKEEEMVDSIAEIIRGIVASGAITLRMEPKPVARLLMVVWEGMAVRGAMAGADEDRLRDAGGEALGRLVQALMT